MKRYATMVLIPRHTSVPVMFLMLAFTTLSAQQSPYRITFGQPSATVEAVMREIRRQARVTFVFDTRTLDITRVVDITGTDYDLKGAVELITYGTDYTYMIKEDYIVINSTPKRLDTPQKESRDPRYVPSDPNRVEGSWLDRNPVTSYPIPVPVDNVAPNPLREYPSPYSTYNHPDIYKAISKKLPLLAVKTNVLYSAAALTPSLAGEIGITTTITLEVGGSWNRFNRIGTTDDNRKLNHWILRPEVRWWLSQRFDGHFLGIHAFYSQYNISNHKVPMMFKKAYRYEGSAFGAGVTYGYHLPLAKRWGVEFHAGIGVARLKYDRFDCILCSNVNEHNSKTYLGPTRAGISLVFMIK